jgi:hypothetical protein
VAATRTQIYLTDQQRQRIDKIVEAEGVSLAEVVRRALDSYLATAVPDPRSALESTYGALPDIEVPNRDEWHRGSDLRKLMSRTRPDVRFFRLPGSEERF